MAILHKSVDIDVDVRLKRSVCIFKKKIIRYLTHNSIIQIELLTLQILQKPSNIICCGFFTIDNSMIFGVIYNVVFNGLRNEIC